MPLYFDTVSQGEGNPKLRISGTRVDLLGFADELKRQAMHAADGQKDPLRFNDVELKSHEFDIEIRALTKRDMELVGHKGAQRTRLMLIIWLGVVGAIVALYLWTRA